MTTRQRIEIVFYIVYFALVTILGGIILFNELDYERPQTVLTTEIYTHYTLVKVNDAITEIYTDDTYHVSCDGYIPSDEGQTCVLAGEDSIKAFWSEHG